MELFIDIIIPTYKRQDLLSALLAKLIPLIKGIDKIIVVYQSNLPSIVLENANVSFVKSSPPNLPKARNRGIVEGKNPLILFLDDDVVPDENLLERHRGSYVNDEIGAVAGYLDDPLFDKTVQIPSSFDVKTGECIQNFSVFKSQYVITAMGANMSFRRSALKRAGNFDCRFKRNAYWEDIDTVFRVRACGYKVWYEASAKVKHLRGENGGCRSDRGSKYIYNQFGNTAYFACKHIPAQYWKSWVTFWKYRLEYYSRKNKISESKYRHDFLMISFGVVGAFDGFLRYLFAYPDIRKIGTVCKTQSHLVDGV